MSELNDHPKGTIDIDEVIAALQDPVLEVRASAYQALQSVDSAKAKAAIADGMLLNPGDRYYSVYKSAIYFDDEWFHLNIDWHELSDELKAAGNYTLLGKLWRDGVGEFAFVLEESISEPQYLRFDNPTIGGERSLAC